MRRAYAAFMPAGFSMACYKIVATLSSGITCNISFVSYTEKIQVTRRIFHGILPETVV